MISSVIYVTNRYFMCYLIYTLLVIKEVWLELSED